MSNQSKLNVQNVSEWFKYRQVIKNIVDLDKLLKYLNS